MKKNNMRWYFNDMAIRKVSNDIISNSPESLRNISLGNEDLTDTVSSLVKNTIATVNIPVRFMKWLKDKIEKENAAPEAHEKAGTVVMITNEEIEDLLMLGLTDKDLYKVKSGPRDAKEKGKKVEDAPYVYVREVKPDVYSGFFNVGDWTLEYSTKFEEVNLKTLTLMLLSYIGVLQSLSLNLMKTEGIVKNNDIDKLLSLSDVVEKSVKNVGLPVIYGYKEVNKHKTFNKIPEFLVPFLKEKKASNYLKKSASAIYHIPSRTATVYEDIVYPLQVVPKAIIAWVHNLVSDMKVGQYKEVEIPLRPVVYDEDGPKSIVSESNHQEEELSLDTFTIRIEKKGQDSFTGVIMKNNKELSSFEYSPIPAIALFIMSSLELYSSFIDNTEIPTKIFRAHSYIFDPKLMAEAIKEALKDNDEVEYELEEDEEEDSEETEEEYEEEMELPSQLEDLEDYIDQLVNEKMEEYFSYMQMQYYHPPQYLMRAVPMPHPMMPTSMVKAFNKPMRKNDTINKLRNVISNRKRQVTIENPNNNCSYCGEELVKNDKLKLCVCFGEHMNKTFKLKKSDRSISISVPKKIDKDFDLLLIKSLTNLEKENG